MKTLGYAVLGAAITADGKLAETPSSSGEWPDWFAVQPGDVLLAANGRADAVDRLRELWTRADTQRVVCFGGPRVFRRLFDARLVADVFLLVRPAVDGRRHAATLSGTSDKFFPEAIRCRLLKVEVRGQECLLHYRALRTGPKRAASP